MKFWNTYHDDGCVKQPKHVAFIDHNKKCRAWTDCFIGTAEGILQIQCYLKSQLCVNIQIPSSSVSYTTLWKQSNSSLPHWEQMNNVNHVHNIVIHMQYTVSNNYEHRKLALNVKIPFFF